MLTQELENPYRNIEYISTIEQFGVYVGTRPRVLIATCDTLDEAVAERDHFLAVQAHKRATREKAVYPTQFETRADHAA
jgi:hypothetical protein